MDKHVQLDKGGAVGGGVKDRSSNLVSWISKRNKFRKSLKMFLIFLCENF